MFEVTVGLLASFSLAIILFLAAVAAYNRLYVDYEYRIRAWPEATAFEPPLKWHPDSPDRVRVLVIRGGALMGLADPVVLREIEERSGKRIHELFDFLAGSSTGAIVSTLLLFPTDETGRPMSAADAIDRYRTMSGDILTAPVFIAC